MKGLFLDLDGTLADSLHVMKLVYFDFLAKFGRRGTSEEFQQLNGPSLREVLEILREKHCLNEPVERISATYDHLLSARYSEASLSPGGSALLSAAKEKKVPVWIVTSNKEAVTRAWMNRVGIRPMISGIVGMESVNRGKPDAEPYSTALKRSGCDPHISIAVEDSETGVLSALAAGLRTYLYGSSANPEFDSEILAGRITSLESLVSLLG